MRVLLISHTCQSATEGQPKAEHLGQMSGVDLCVLSPDRWKHYGKWRAPQVPSGPSYRYEVGHVRLPWAGPGQFYLHYYPQLAKLLRDFRPEIIDLWEEPWAAVSAHACWLRDRLLPGCKVISETEQNINRTLPPPFEWFRSYVLKRADYAVARSTEAAEVLRARGYRGGVEVVPNGVDVELFRPMNRSEARASLGIATAPGEFLVGYVGRLVPEKGLADLVQALRQLPRHVNAVLVGDGSMADQLRAAAAEPALRGRLHVLPGRPLQQLPGLMNALDALVLPSRTTTRWKEQFGRVIIEAQACGTPVIGSSSGAIPDVIGAGGMVFPEGDVNALAAAMAQLAAAPDAARQMGNDGRAAAHSQYSWQCVARQMYEIYQKVCAPEASLPQPAAPAGAV